MTSRRKRADTRALQLMQAAVKADLQWSKAQRAHDAAERAISRLQSEGKIARHFKASRQFHQTGETA